MSDVIQSLTEQAVDVFVIQSVEDVPSLFAGFDQPHLAQGRQLVRYGGVRHLQCSSQLVHAEFALHQRGEDAHPGGVAERLESLSQSSGSVPINHMFLDVADTYLVQVYTPAPVFPPRLCLHRRPSSDQTTYI